MNDVLVKGSVGKLLKIGTHQKTETLGRQKVQNKVVLLMYWQNETYQGIDNPKVGVKWFLGRYPAYHKIAVRSWINYLPMLDYLNTVATY